MGKQILVGGTDLIGKQELMELVIPGPSPCVSIFMPTHRNGPQTQQDPILLRKLLGEAKSQLESYGMDHKRSDGLLAPLIPLIDDGDFWKHPADGLALYRSPSLHRRFRVQIPLNESAAVSTSFQVRPLLPLLTGDSRFFLLALSQNQVKLYEATRSTIAEVPLGPIPSNMAEALPEEESERPLQYRSLDGGSVQFFGSGAGGKVDKNNVERFLRAVDRGVVQLLGENQHPLILAGVDYYLPIYRAISRYPHLCEHNIEGNPEHLSPIEMHAEAWPLVKPLLDESRKRALDRLREAPTSRVENVITDVVASAMEGSIDSLLITPGPPVWGRIDPATRIVEEGGDPNNGGEDLLERAVADTLISGGNVFSVNPADLNETPVAAVLRF